MMLYKNAKVKVHSLDEHTDYFGIVAGVLQGDTLAPYPFIICRDYVLRTSIDFKKENGFKLAKEGSRRYPSHKLLRTRTMPMTAFLANSHAQAKTLFHSLARAASGIGLHGNADTIEYIFLNQRSDISTLKGGPLKLMDKFTYFRSSASSTENDINTRLAKVWTDIERLSVKWKSDLTDKIKRSVFLAAVVYILLYRCTT